MINGGTSTRENLGQNLSQCFLVQLQLDHHWPSSSLSSLSFSTSTSSVSWWPWWESPSRTGSQSWSLCRGVALHSEKACISFVFFLHQFCVFFASSLCFFVFSHQLCVFSFFLHQFCVFFCISFVILVLDEAQRKQKMMTLRRRMERRLRKLLWRWS